MSRWNFFSEYKDLDRQVYVMAVAAFINCFAEFVVLFFSLYLTQVLGYSVAKAGIMVALLELVHIPGSLVGGKLADRLGRKKVMLFSQSSMGICYLACGWFLRWEYAPFLIILGKFFDGITDPAREALETDITRPEQRQAAFSMIYQSFNMAFAIGPLFAGLLYNSHPRLLFLGSGVMQLVVVVIVAVKVKESLPSQEMVEKSKTGGERAGEGSTLNVLASRPQLLWFSLGVAFCAFSYRQVTFSLPLQVTSLFGTGGTNLYSTIISLNSVLVVFCNPVMLKVSRKHAIVSNLVVASLLYALSFTLFGFSTVVWQFYALTIGYTTGELLMNNNDRAYRFANTPINYRGRFSAVLKLFQSAGRMAGPLIGGFVIVRSSFQWLWVATGITAFIGMLCFARLASYEGK